MTNLSEMSTSHAIIDSDSYPFDATTACIMKNREYPRRILLCATGEYPQVITETLYALITERHFIPTEIHTLGTSQSRAGILSLFANDSPYQDLCREFGLEGKIRFDESCMHIISAPDGTELEDIFLPDEIAIAADAAIDIVRSLCQEDDSCLHVSMTGGRKTLSFVVGHALSLFARPQDVLSHVLVPGGFEYNDDFYYPTQRKQDLTRWNHLTRQQEPVLAKEAQIMLADIPIVHLRKNLPDNFLTAGNYSDTVKAVQYSLNNPGTMRFDLKNRFVICDDQKIKLQPGQLMMLLWLAERKTQGLPGIAPALDDSLCQDYLDFAENIYPRIPRAQNPRDSIETQQEFIHKFNELRARINGAIKSALPQEELHERFLIHSRGKKGALVYELATPADNIDISLVPMKH